MQTGLKIKSKNSKVREAAYYKLVRSQPQFTPVEWLPYTKDRLSKIERVHRIAARWTVANFERHAHVVEMTNTLDGDHCNKDGLMFVSVFFYNTIMKK